MLRKKSTQENKEKSFALINQGEWPGLFPLRSFIEQNAW